MMRRLEVVLREMVHFRLRSEAIVEPYHIPSLWPTKAGMKRMWVHRRRDTWRYVSQFGVSNGTLSPSSDVLTSVDAFWLSC